MQYHRLLHKYDCLYAVKAGINKEFYSKKPQITACLGGKHAFICGIDYQLLALTNS
jgi:hypothetical protein